MLSIRQLFTKLVARWHDKRLQEYREFVETYYAAHAWTLVKCPMCSTPATAPDARFCAFCSASLYGSNSKLHPLMAHEQHTDPAQFVPERPCLAYRHEHHQDTGPHTLHHRAIQKEEKHHS